MTAVDQMPGTGTGTGAAPPASGDVTTVKVAVVAHRRKSLGGGLSELRRALGAAGITDPAWFEVPKSKKAPKQVRRALKQGAELILVWGGDGMVQRCIDTMAGSERHRRDHPRRDGQPPGQATSGSPTIWAGPSGSPSPAGAGASTSASSTASTSRSWPAPGSMPA